MISDNTYRLNIPEGEVRELASPQGLLWERAVSKFAARLEQAYVTRDNGIKSLKAYGGSPVKHKADKLWGRYVPCEYIESHGTEYINTGIKTSSNHGYDIKFVKTTSSGDFIVIGTKNVGASAKWGLNPAFDMLIQWDAAYIPTGISVVQNEIYEVKSNYFKDGEWSVKDKNGTLSEVSFTNNYNAYLFAGSWGSADPGYFFVGKVWFAKITDNNTLVRDFIPVKDIVNNVYGLWDRVEGKFYGNAGTGAFTGGELIQPIAYAEIPLGGYLEFDVTNTQDTRWLADMKYIPDATQQKYPWIGGFRTYVNDVGIAKQMIELVNSNTARLYLQYSGNAETNVTLPEPFNSRDRHVYGWDANKVLVDGTVVYTETAETFTGADKLKIGAIKSSSGISVNFTGNCYKVQSWKDGIHQDIDAIPIRVGTTVYMLDLVEWKLYANQGTGTFTAGADIPYTQLCPDIIKVNTGDIRYGVGKNLFDISQAVWGKNIDKDDIEASSQYNSHSDYIECKPNTTYTVSWIANISGVITRYHEYDGNKTWLRQITTHNASYVGEHSVTFTTGATARYIRFTFRGKSKNSSDLSTNIQLEEGSTATPYEPYHFGIHTEGSHKLTVSGVNLFDKSTAEVLTGYITNVGVGYATYIHSGTSERTILFKCKPSTTYTISKVSTDRLRIAEFPSKPVTSSSVVTKSKLLYTDGDKTVATVTTDGNGEWLAIQVSNFAFGGSQPTLQDVLDSLQVELGSTATPYQPYISPISRDIPMLLSADSNLDVQSGVKTEAWGIKVLDGTETWNHPADNTIVYLPLGDGLTGDPTTFRIPLPCSHFVGTGELNANMPHYSVKLSVTNAAPNISKVWIKMDGNAIDLTLFKSWLASEYAKGTPVIILYPLANPVTEQVSIAPVTSARRTTYVADSDSELGKTSLELDFLGKYGIPANDENDV